MVCVVVSVFLLIIYFVYLYMPLTIQDVSKCYGKEEKFNQLILNENLSNVKFRSCIPRKSVFYEVNPYIVVKVVGYTEKIKGYFCSIFPELDVSKIRIVDKDPQKITSEFNGIITTEFKYPDYIDEISFSSCENMRAK